MRRSILFLAGLGALLQAACGDASGVDSGLTSPTPGGAAGKAGSAGKAGGAGTAGSAGSTGGGAGASVAGAGGAGGAGAGGAGNAGGEAGAGGDPGAGAGGEAGSAGEAGQAGQAGAAGVAGGGGEAGSAGSGPPPCSAGTIVCEGGAAKVCDGNGGFSETTVCAKVCVDKLGCAECEPNKGSCEGNKAIRCKPDGSGVDVTTCDPELGLECASDSGACLGACSPDSLQRSYIGCEYFPTVTSNGGLFSGFSFAIAVANAANEEATVTVRRGDQVIEQVKVAPLALQTIKLPWVEELRNSYENAATLEEYDQALRSKVVTDGAYHVKSTRPVTVYQFNPLEFKIPDPGGCPKQGSPDCNAYTNDASLLLPTNALGNEYFVASAPPLVQSIGSFSPTVIQLPGLTTITASSDDTDVTVTAAGYIRAGDGVQAMQPGGTQTFKLNQGDVVQLLAAKTPDNKLVGCELIGYDDDNNPVNYCTTDKAYDLTSTSIVSTKPVTVLGGHDCARIPYNKAACDHLEESIFPLNTLGTQVILTAPQAVTGAAVGDGKADGYMLRVISAVDGNTVTLDPPIAPGGTLNKGQYADVPLTDKDVIVNASGPVLVTQFMLGADQVDPINSGTVNSKGDPSMSLGIASAQYRTSYTFLAPESYTFNFVNIVAPTGTVVKLDGEDITINGAPIGASSFSVLRKKINGGSHSATSDQPFGIVVYGYGQYTSYMYPGGLNLNKL